jgi:lysophospholipase L1-like esterase
MKSVFKKSVLTMTLVSILSQESVAQEQIPQVPERMPASMGALGDSMSAGALAMFRRQDFVLPWTEFLVAMRAILVGVSGKLDSIESRKLSWAAGYDPYRRVESHSYRLTQIQHLKKQIPTYNAAVTGDESQHVINGQLGRLNEWSKKNVNKEYPDYVTLMIGPNDACADSTAHMVDTNTYYSNVSRAVDEILAKSPDSKIMVGSIPNIDMLRGVAKDERLYWGVKCEALWKTVKLCPTLTTLSDPYERSIVATRIADYNNALEDIVESRRAAYGDRIRYASKTYDAKFTADQLSVDCFHPNKHGQAFLADLTWSDSWWTKEWEQRRTEIVKEEDKKRRKHNQCMAHKAANPKVFVHCP